jgi:UDP-glucose 4-epimerase
MKDRRILVTGGGGFIGSARAKFLLKKGFKVRVFDLSEQITRTSLPEEAEVYRGSILDTNDLMNAMKDCNCVIHLAAKLGVETTEIKRLECLNINIQGTVNVLEACVKDNIEKIVFASSSEVYGDQEKIPISEENPLNPKSIYAVTKLTGEEYIKAYKRRYGLEYSIVRFFNVYGPGQVAEFVMSKFIRNVKKDKSPIIYGDGSQVRAFCYVDDAVKGAYLALSDEKATAQIFNIGNDTEPISMKDLALEVMTIGKKKIKPIFIPLDKSDRTEKREIKKRIPDISKAKRVLGYEPKVSLSEGVLRIMQYGKIKETWSNPREK